MRWNPEKITRFVFIGLMTGCSPFILNNVKSAMASDVLVSNLQHGNSIRRITVHERAQGFQTGIAKGGYVISAISVGYDDPDASPFRLRLCDADANEFPSGTCTNFDPPSSFPRNPGTVTFTPRSYTRLNPNTKYVVHLRPVVTSGTDLLSATDTTDNSYTKIHDGWNISPAGTIRSVIISTGQNWFARDDGKSLKIAIHGTTYAKYDKFHNTTADGTITVRGVPNVGKRLSVYFDDIVDWDGFNWTGQRPNWRYQWIRVVGGVHDIIQGETGSSYLLSEADEGKQIRVRVRFRDDEGHEELLTSGPYPNNELIGPRRLAVYMNGTIPEVHKGEDFSFKLRFTENIPSLSYKTLRDSAFDITNGSVVGARRLKRGSNASWEITIRPDSTQWVKVHLPRGSICTDDSRCLVNSTTAYVLYSPDKPGVSVSNAQVQEGPGALLSFAVTLDTPATEVSTVNYATLEESNATPGVDYVATSGTLTFNIGEDRKTIEVSVIDDSHNEGFETLVLELSNPSGLRIADGRGIGKIINSDPLPKAWVSRFGRTVVDQVMGAVDARIHAPRHLGASLTLAGQTIGGNRVSDDILYGRDKVDFQPRAIDGNDLLIGSSFAITGGKSGTGVGGIWGSGATSNFEGQDRHTTVEGNVQSLMLGADWEFNRGIAGFAVAY